MKRFFKRLVPFTLTLGILASIAWYLFVYDRAFTRDFLISQARFFDARGNTDFAATLYDLAYDYTGKDEDVAIELANQYKADGNYTKAEYTLTHAIADGGSVDLYIALCKTFVEQDKLLDAVAMLDSISDPAIRMELDSMRPKAPEPDYPDGFYNQYIHVSFLTSDGTLYYTTDGNYPSTSDAPFSDPIELPGGETSIYAIRVGENGLVSPLAILAYTVGGVVEPAKFEDPAVELAVREILGVEEEDVVMTDQLWEIKEFVFPSDAAVFTDLKLLPYLEKLTIPGRNLDTLAYLTSLTELRELDLSGCRFSPAELKILAGLPNLEKLSLADCGLSTIADLAGAQKLTYLDVSNNTLRNLEPLIPMTTLQELYLQHNAVTALDALSPLSELKKLDVSYNTVSSLMPLGQCAKLEWLNAGNNSIASVNGMEVFTALKHLDLDHNLLSNVDALGNCLTLTELNISNNNISNVYALSTLSNLVALNCSYNQLQELPSFQEGCALSVLEASYNEITSLYNIRHAKELTYVYMDYNKLTNIDIIADCYRLVMVNVYGNKIKDVSKLTAHNIIVNYDPT